MIMDLAAGGSIHPLSTYAPVENDSLVARRPRTNMLDALSHEAQLAIISAARDQKTVSGLTHGFYRYPARFPPQMVRAVIDHLSRPGDLVLDPFAGGATSLVEAYAANRRAVGCDISTLATFVGRVKTTLLDDPTLELIGYWADSIGQQINIHGPTPSFTFWEEAGYFKNLDKRSHWRLKKALMQSVESASQLTVPGAEAFARCVILRTAQWALESRRQLPSIGEFRVALSETAADMIAGMQALRRRVQHVPAPVCISRSIIGLEDQFAPGGLPKADLVVTSPPYPGVHVLYHRWQVDGRRETGAPFWIANALDGSGLSYYTMGDRKRPGLTTYFDNLERGLGSLRKTCASHATIVQVVAFSQPEWQLARYLEVAAAVGLEEQLLPALEGEGDGRLWREVPNRRWYAEQRGATHGSREVMLFHRVRG